MVQSMFTAAYRQVIEAVVRLRQAAGLTQRELAKSLGREQSYIGRIETGQRRIDLVEFVWVCNACGADPSAEAQRLIKSIATHAPPRHRTRR